MILSVVLLHLQFVGIVSALHSNHQPTCQDLFRESSPIPPPQSHLASTLEAAKFIVTAAGVVETQKRLITLIMQPPTDAGGLPQVNVIHDFVWQHSFFDFEHDVQLPFDNYGEYLHGHASNNVFQAQTCIGPKVTPRQVNTSKIYFESLQPMFGWLPIDVIGDTFANTTQYYCICVLPHLKK